MNIVSHWAVMELFPSLPFLVGFRVNIRSPRRFRVRRSEMEDQDISSFLAACAKQFCPWCGTPVGRNINGRPRKFCSDKCRYDYWNYEKRHKAEKTEMEAKLNEKR